MPFNTLAVGAAVTPTVIETGFSHYLNRNPLRQKPTAHISYHVGLNLIRQFLTFASHHTVEELQAFTSQWVPNPRWVRTEDVDISESHLKTAAAHIESQLGPKGLEATGGRLWWQWRREGVPLKAEWIEMRKDFNLRKQKNENCTRCMLYVHGGAYYFGSVDEHRYQLQRHARKLQARVLAPRYRLAPQFPFPCGLLDCLATYLQLLESQPPETIILAGDSAGGGMVLSLMVILRDQGVPLPAGGILLSPWADLTHSFPSVAGQNTTDYVPAHGFLHRPDMSWPPPNSDDLKALDAAKRKNQTASSISAPPARDIQTAAQGFKVTSPDGEEEAVTIAGPDVAENLSITIDGKLVEIKDQIQMYATNTLISHPLVSPVLQASLGGLPPLCVLVGGGEMLRDEQIYLAHKAAAPSAYPPSAAALNIQGASLADVEKYPPTYVQLQVWDDMCHVAPTLSFTRPAKFMYRSVAQFGAWALARAQNGEISIMDDDEVSVISSTSSSDGSSKVNSKESIDKQSQKPLKHTNTLSPMIGKAGDALPKFVNHMVRQRVTRHGEIFELAAASTLPACTMPPEEIGKIKPGPVRKWMHSQREWSRRYSKHKMQVQERRMREMTTGEGYEVFEGETPPPTALAGRRKKDYKPKKQEKKKSRGLAMWSGWGSKHDEDTLEREEEKGKGKGHVDKKAVVDKKNAKSATGDDIEVSGGAAQERLNLRTRAVSDEGQANEDEGVASMSALVASRSPIRPAVAGQAFPFKLAVPFSGEPNASTATLHDHDGVIGAGAHDSTPETPSTPKRHNISADDGYGLTPTKPTEDDEGNSGQAEKVENGTSGSRLFTGSGFKWDQESLGAPSPEREPVRPSGE